MIDNVLSKTAVFVSCYKNEFNYSSTFNDFYNDLIFYRDCYSSVFNV